MDRILGLSLLAWIYRMEIVAVALQIEKEVIRKDNLFFYLYITAVYCL